LPPFLPCRNDPKIPPAAQPRRCCAVRSGSSDEDGGQAAVRDFLENLGRSSDEEEEEEEGKGGGARADGRAGAGSQGLWKRLRLLQKFSGVDLGGRPQRLSPWAGKLPIWLAGGLAGGLEDGLADVGWRLVKFQRALARAGRSADSMLQAGQ
jgi:hypothetical protein